MSEIITPRTYKDITSLNDFFEEYGTTLADKAERRLRPLHIPGTDPIPWNWSQKFPKGEFSRLPYEPQAHVIEASRKALGHQHMVWIIGEPGTGKTLMGACTAHMHAGGQPYRAMVMCPTHLCDKWQREIEETIPNALVHVVEHWTEILHLVPETIPFKFNLWPEAEGPEWTIIGKNKAKLGPGWHPAVTSRPDRAKVEVLYCPECGGTLKNDDGDPLTRAGLPKSRKRLRCTNMRGYIRGDSARPDEPPAWVERECGAILWSYDTETFFRWAPEKVINTKLRGYYDYLVLDEVHEYKGANTAQANAAGAIASVAKNTIALTGTLIGGYASHIFPLTFRLCPRSLVEEGFEWGDTLEFCRRYGKVDRIVRVEGAKKSERSNKNSRGGTGGGKTIEKEAPGILPSLYGRHVMGHTVFLGLAEMAKNLPKLDEAAVECDMDQELWEAMEEVNEELVPIACEMAAQGNMKLLGAMLEVLLYYPDHPFGWGEIGYEDDILGWVPVMTPRQLDSGIIRPKEKAVIEFVKQERRAGNQVWIYIQRNGDRDVLDRLQKLLTKSGFNALTMRSSVDPDKRERWIEQQGRGVDAMISHPQLVETGLDLFSKKRGGHNYSSIWFHQTGYRPFTMMQASRRAWRLSQRKRCKVRYAYYKDCVQAGCMSLMGHKIKAMLSLQGQYSEEGLAAMAGDDADAMSIAKVITGKIQDTGRVWQQVTNQIGTAFAESHEGHEDEEAVEAPNVGISVTADLRAEFLRDMGMMLQPAAKHDVTRKLGATPKKSTRKKK